jgi:hypothetical protein
MEKVLLKYVLLIAVFILQQLRYVLAMEAYMLGKTVTLNHIPGASDL